MDPVPWCGSVSCGRPDIGGVPSRGTVAPSHVPCAWLTLPHSAVPKINGCPAYYVILKSDLLSHFRLVYEEGTLLFLVWKKNQWPSYKMKEQSGRSALWTTMSAWPLQVQVALGW